MNESQKRLEVLREAALSQTQSIIKDLSFRKNLIKKIQVLKDSPDSNLDPERESLVFDAIDNLKDLDIKDILIFSLIIESHASSHGSYPRWSEGEHIDGDVFKISHQINPILLFKYCKTSYDALPLKEEFKSKLEVLWRNNER